MVIFLFQEAIDIKKQETKERYRKVGIIIDLESYKKLTLLPEATRGEAHCRQDTKTLIRTLIAQDSIHMLIFILLQ